MYYARIFNSKMNYGLFILLPSFSGNTGGYLSSACQEEHYLIKWYSIDNQIISNFHNCCTLFSLRGPFLF